MLGFLSRFIYVIDAKKSELILLLIAFLLISVLDALGIGLIGPFIGLAINPDAVYQNDFLKSIYTFLNLSDSKQFIGVLGLGISILFFIKSYVYYQVQKYLYDFCFSQEVKLRRRLLRTYLSLPYTFHLKTNTAHLIQNLVGETQNFTNNITIPFFNLVASGIVVIVLLLLLATTSPLATVTIFGILMFAFLPIYYYRHQILHWGKEVVESNTEMIRIINHAVGGFKETKLIGCEDFFEAQLVTQVNRFGRAASLFHVFKILPRITLEALLIAFVVVFVFVSLFLGQSSASLMGVLGIFAVASIRLLPSASMFMASLSVLRNFHATLDKLYLDLKEMEKPETLSYLRLTQGKAVPATNGKLPASTSYRTSDVLPFRDRIVLQKLSYRYPESQTQSLTNISLTLRKGESIALIGKSGAGKTTLVDVFLGLLIPESGDIQVDGRSVYKSLRAWQNLIGYIPQSIFLMDDTIERNIAFGVPDQHIDRDKLKQAVELAQLSELVTQLPEGLQTNVGEHGVRLSGGQRQRIGIARALYHEREILILDEATSALDNETENLISRAIQQLSRTKTMIIIAHRLTTVEHCDRIYKLAQGRVVKCGSYEEIVLADQLKPATTATRD